MTREVKDSNQNGRPIHYFANSGQRCHPAIIAGNYDWDGAIPEEYATDVIQMDAISLGVIVPLRRNGVAFDITCTTDDTVHWLPDCNRV